MAHPRSEAALWLPSLNAIALEADLAVTLKGQLDSPGV